MIPDLDAVPVPPSVIESIQKYLKDGIRPGSFVVACLENNLTQAFIRADEKNLPCIGAIVGWLLDNAPANAWGSPAIVKRYMEKKFRDDVRWQLRGES